MGKFPLILILTVGTHAFATPKSEAFNAVELFRTQLPALADTLTYRQTYTEAIRSIEILRKRLATMTPGASGKGLIWFLLQILGDQASWEFPDSEARLLVSEVKAVSKDLPSQQRRLVFQHLARAARLIEASSDGSHQVDRTLFPGNLRTFATRFSDLTSSKVDDITASLRTLNEEDSAPYAQQMRLILNPAIPAEADIRALLRELANGNSSVKSVLEDVEILRYEFCADRFIL